MGFYSDKGTGSCAAQIQQLASEMFELQNLVNTSLVDLLAGGASSSAGAKCSSKPDAGSCSAPAEEDSPSASLAADVAERVKPYGLDLDQLASDPCALQLVLFPFGTDKGDVGDYNRYSGPVETKALQAWLLDQVGTVGNMVIERACMLLVRPGVHPYTVHLLQQIERSVSATCAFSLPGAAVKRSLRCTSDVVQVLQFTFNHLSLFLCRCLTSHKR